MKSKLLTLNHQRNGVSGESFFACTFQNVFDTKGTFLATFRLRDENEEKDEIDHVSCRVVMLSGKEHSLYECWRGDRIANEIQKMIQAAMDKTETVSFIDLGWHMENKAKGDTTWRTITYRKKIDTDNPYSAANALTV